MRPLFPAAFAILFSGLLAACTTAGGSSPQHEARESYLGQAKALGANDND